MGSSGRTGSGGKWAMFLAGAVAGTALFAVWARLADGGSGRAKSGNAQVADAGKDRDRLRDLEREVALCHSDREKLVQGVSGCIEDSNETEEGLTKQLSLANSVLARFRETAESPMGEPMDLLARGLVSVIIQHDGSLSRCTGYLVRRDDDVRLFTAGHCVDGIRGEAWLHLVRYRYDPGAALLMPDAAAPLISFEHSACRRDGEEDPQGALGNRTGKVDLANYELVRGGRAGRCLEISAGRTAPPGSGREPPEQAARALLEAARPEGTKIPGDFEQVYFVAHVCQRPRGTEEKCVQAADGWAYLPVVATVIGRTGGDGVPFFVMNQRARPGDSGGPIVGLDGSLLGLVSATHMGKSISLFAPVAAVWQ